MSRSSRPTRTRRPGAGRSPRPDPAGVRRLPQAGRIIAAWRRLTSPARARRSGPGDLTIIGLSGGADSSALLLALCAGPVSIRKRLIAVHVLHDLRPRDQALGDRDRARALCDGLGVEFVEREVSVHGAIRGGLVEGRPPTRNFEAVARRLRYRALAEEAVVRGARFIATAHHADDHLETVLMHLLRGSGLRGLAGIAPSRALPVRLNPSNSAESRVDSDGPGDRGVTQRLALIRPLLAAGVGRADSVLVCRAAGFEWAEDRTNSDTTRLRAAIRGRVLPELKRLRPACLEASVRCAELLRDADRLTKSAAQRVVERADVRVEGAKAAYRWPRSALRRRSVLVIGETLRQAAADRGQNLPRPSQAADSDAVALSRGVGVVGGAAAEGMDRLTGRVLLPVIAAIRDDSTEPRRFRLPGLDVRVTAGEVCAVTACPAPAPARPARQSPRTKSTSKRPAPSRRAPRGRTTRGG